MVTEQAREAVSARIATANLKPEQFRAACLSHRFSRPGSTPDDRGIQALCDDAFVILRSDHGKQHFALR